MKQNPRNRSKSIDGSKVRSGLGAEIKVDLVLELEVGIQVVLKVDLDLGINIKI